LRAAFDGAPPLTVGFEDEVMLLDPASFALAPRAREILEMLGGDNRFTPELPASQLEIGTTPVDRIGEAARQLLAARQDLVERTQGLVALGATGVHPFSPGSGELNDLPRYHHSLERNAPVIGRQLVCAFQVHVALGSAEAALAVFNAARSYLPLLAALAANSPFYEGRDTGMASVRPKISELLPRQGVPPTIESWDALADDLNWGSAANAFRPGSWWWELRPHRRFGTLEFRVPDAQRTVGEAAAIAAVVQSLVAQLAERAQNGERLAVAPAWRIAENRWSACRDGVLGQMADLQTGEVRPTRAWLRELLDELEPFAGDLHCSDELAGARALIECNGAIKQREVAGRDGVEALGPWLSRGFLAPWPG
jgi:carboxylate-amine ligase